MPDDSHIGSNQRFPSTRWSLVLAVGDVQNTEGREALASLCKTYWSPVYGYIRRKGNDPESARDLTQGFFARFLEKGSFSRADPAHGRFRSYLLGAVNHYLADEWDRTRAQKRGGGEPCVSLDVETAEGQYRLEPGHDWTPEKAFERRWALTLLQNVLEKLRREQGTSSTPERFARLQGLLTGDSLDAPYKQVAAELGISEGALKTTVHRLRQRYGRLLRQEVAETVDDPSGVDDEIRYLISVLGS